MTIQFTSTLPDTVVCDSLYKFTWSGEWSRPLTTITLENHDGIVTTIATFRSDPDRLNLYYYYDWKPARFLHDGPGFHVKIEQDGSFDTSADFTISGCDSPSSIVNSQTSVGVATTSKASQTGSSVALTGAGHSSTASPSLPSSSTNATSTLSSGAKVGISVAIVLIVSFAVVLFFFLLRIRRSKRKQKLENEALQAIPELSGDGKCFEKDSGTTWSHGVLDKSELVEITRELSGDSEVSDLKDDVPSTGTKNQMYEMDGFQGAPTNNGHITPTATSEPVLPAAEKKASGVVIARKKVEPGIPIASQPQSQSQPSPLAEEDRIARLIEEERRIDEEIAEHERIKELRKQRASIQDQLQRANYPGR